MERWTMDETERQALLEFLRRLVQTPSLPGNEGRVAACVQEEMQRLGFQDVHTDAIGNVIGRLGPAEGRGLMFNSHMDTVEVTAPEAWTVDPWGAEVREGRLYGRGSCDMKAGLAATIHGAALAVRRGAELRQPLWVTCVVMEEPAEGLGTRELFERDGLRPAWVVIAEPSGLDVVRAQRGHIEMRVTVNGQSAHSSSPHLGQNAIYAASRLIFGLEILAGQLQEDPFLGPGVLAVTDIRAHAVSRNAIPHRCELVIDRRLTVGETESLAQLEIQRIIAREDVKATVEIIEDRLTTYTGETRLSHRASLPWMLDERHPLIVATIKAAREAGLHPTLTRWPFATEGAYSAGVAQVPTVGFGPGDPAIPHTVDEYVEVAQVYAAAQTYAALAARLLGRD